MRADKGTSEPRAILSPGVPRNGVSPLRIVVELDKPELFWLDIGQNPENAVKARLYRENFVETPLGFMPDTLTEVSIPYRGFESDFRLPDQKAVTFWLEMGVAKDAPVDRIKVEPELYVESMKDWFVYPMEVRIQEPVLPNSGSVVRRTATEPAVTAPADAAIFSVICADLGIRSDETERKLRTIDNSGIASQICAAGYRVAEATVGSRRTLSQGRRHGPKDLVCRAQDTFNRAGMVPSPSRCSLPPSRRTVVPVNRRRELAKWFTFSENFFNSFHF